MRNELMKSSDIPGPTISGTVTVPLAELDRMRLDHANLKKLCEELESHKMEVLVIVKEERYSPRIDRRGNYYTGNDFCVVSQNYKGLDDVKKVIRQELIDEDIIKSKALNKELENLKIESSGKINNLETIKINLTKELTDLKADKIKVDVELVEMSKTIEDQKDQIQSQNDVIEYWKNNAKKLSNDLDKERKKKGFWSFLN